MGLDFLVHFFASTKFLTIECLLYTTIFSPWTSTFGSDHIMVFYLLVAIS